MRIWSLHPKYLDSKGIVALWREALLAKKVLEGGTSGYRNHPQLIRFKNSGFALDAINQYLAVVYEDALKRGYHFDRNKINWNFKSHTLTVSDRQLEYEMDHLLKKLKTRAPELYLSFSGEIRMEPHPLFTLIKGEIEAWEII